MFPPFTKNKKQIYPSNIHYPSGQNDENEEQQLKFNENNSNDQISIYSQRLPLNHEPQNPLQFQQPQYQTEIQPKFPQQNKDKQNIENRINYSKNKQLENSHYDNDYDSQYSYESYIDEYGQKKYRKKGKKNQQDFINFERVNQEGFQIYEQQKNNNQDQNSNQFPQQHQQYYPQQQQTQLQPNMSTYDRNEVSTYPQNQSIQQTAEQQHHFKNHEVNLESENSWESYIDENGNKQKRKKPKSKPHQQKGSQNGGNNNFLIIGDPSLVNLVATSNALIPIQNFPKVIDCNQDEDNKNVNNGIQIAKSTLCCCGLFRKNDNPCKWCIDLGLYCFFSPCKCIKETYVGILNMCCSICCPQTILRCELKCKGCENSFMNCFTNCQTGCSQCSKFLCSCCWVNCQGNKICPCLKNVKNEIEEDTHFLTQLACGAQCIACCTCFRKCFENFFQIISTCCGDMCRITRDYWNDMIPNCSDCCGQICSVINKNCGKIMSCICCVADAAIGVFGEAFKAIGSVLE